MIYRYRFKRDVRLLAAKNTYWGAGEIGDAVHLKLVNAQLSRPPGAVFQVPLLLIVLRSRLYFSADSASTQS